MTFLKKFASIMITVGKYAGLISPAAQVMFPGHAGKIEGVADDLAEVAGVVVTIEAIGQSAGWPGPDKLRYAAPLVANVITKSALLIDKKIDDPDLFAAGSTKIADGMADILNSLKDDIETESLT